jgi:hypothetical protein
MTNYFSKIDPYELSLSGKAFMVHYDWALTGNETKYFQMKTGNVTAVMLYQDWSSSSEPIKLTVLETPTVTNGTNEVTAYNKDRQSLTAAVTKFYSNPTSVSSGTAIHVDVITSGKGSGAHSPDVSVWSLKKSTSYVFKVEQLTNQATTVGMELIFAEKVGTLS